jgi:ketosteroid isomerase-like protein
MTRSPGTRLNLLFVVALAFVAPSVASAQGIESPRVPLRTAINEINALRSEYAGYFNKKDVAALTAMYTPDAVVIRADGSTLVGQSAIGKALDEESAKWTQTTFSSDTMRVFGNTAWDVGSMKSSSSTGGENVSHYLAVLRRGLKGWKISSVAVVPETHGKSSE